MRIGSMPLAAITAALLLYGSPPETEQSAFVRGLWLLQQCGTKECCDPASDLHVKRRLAQALGKDGGLKAAKLQGIMKPESVKKLAGATDQIGAEAIRAALAKASPPSRAALLPAVCRHIELLTTSLDMVDAKHRDAGRQLSDWIGKHYQTGKQLDVIVVCTGNSRRSILGATMGNIAAAYYGMPEIRFHSGGTSPTACNQRTVAALQEIGIEVQPTGGEAPRKDPKAANPVYRVRWGSGNLDGAFPLEALEFSKHYSDESNPHEGFAALMVCDEADAACPLVPGADLRLSMPYVDPKLYDDSPFEKAKYAERRDDMGRLMIATMLQVRQRLGK
jgi:arsenate reductase (thioredoxin)